MKITTSIQELREILTPARRSGKTIGLVPTMGALHEGHGSLMDASVAQNDMTVVSVFVNPTQFGAGEDFSVYPRDPEKDEKFCRDRGVDVLFMPRADEMYRDPVITVEPNAMSQILCGVSRPTHFTGVCTVVAKLLNIVQPDHAYFGQKDAQQFFILQKMTEDLNIPVQLHPCPIVREADGLALSSRNAYLNEEERESALVLSRALRTAEQQLQPGEPVAPVLETMKEQIRSVPHTRIDYVEAVDIPTFTLTETVTPHTLIALAVFVGKTRLIDNCIFDHREPGKR